MRYLRWSAAPLVLAAATLIYVAGCNRPVTAPPAPEAKESKPAAKSGAEAKKDAEHGHQAGSHGGIIVEIGRDNYHAEAIFEKGGVLRLYTLGNDEATVQEVEVQEVTAYAKAEGGAESSTFVLEPRPQPGDSKGKTSLFVGTLPKELSGKRVQVTIPSFRVAGQRFRLGFTSQTVAHDGPIPSATEGDEAAKLYLTPGGLYTQADIRANGSMTAPQKYADARASHNLKPALGDKICPVTLTKANPQFTWVVSGKTYEFCCPPCIDEFVGWAKEQPDKIKAPSEYIKRK